MEQHSKLHWYHRLQKQLSKKLGGGISTFCSTLNFIGILLSEKSSNPWWRNLCKEKSILGISGDNITGKSSGGYNSFTSVFMVIQH